MVLIWNYIFLYSILRNVWWYVGEFVYLNVLFVFLGGMGIVLELLFWFGVYGWVYGYGSGYWISLWFF